ncbi:MAG: hypothetical protein XXXJIFNMEKO3_01941 [Candidatus Erwinia impunctatus]|nr:hypothetical protein XXXJIFNMEKO_01941 [Culicoides impunctatus]
MAKNEFKAFATAVNANVTPQSEWETLPVTSTGFQSGKASSAQINKALRQSSFVASCVAQFIGDTLAQDMIDNGDRTSFLTALRQSVVNGSVPAGVPMPWPAAIPPVGWLKCNGASFDKTAYPLLARAYPSGVLPDLRGEFIRGWDDGRGVDAGRQILSYQSDEFRKHNHGCPVNGSTDLNYQNAAAGDSTSTDAWPNSLDSGGNETRPRNIAFNHIVRAA